LRTNRHFCCRKERRKGKERRKERRKGKERRKERRKGKREEKGKEKKVNFVTLC